VLTASWLSANTSNTICGNNSHLRKLLISVAVMNQKERAQFADKMDELFDAVSQELSLISQASDLHTKKSSMDSMQLSVAEDTFHHRADERLETMGRAVEEKLNCRAGSGRFFVELMARDLAAPQYDVHSKPFYNERLQVFNWIEYLTTNPDAQLPAEALAWVNKQN